MPSILKNPIQRTGRQFAPPDGVDEMAELLGESPAGTQVTNDVTYPTRQRAQVAAGQYRDWLERRHGIETTTATGPTPDGKAWIFSIYVPAP